MKTIHVILFLGLLSAAVFAETPVAALVPGEKAPPTRVIYRRSEMESFSGLRLKGELKKPELSYIYQRKGLRAEQIVNIPENFNDEIIEGTGEF